MTPVPFIEAGLAMAEKVFLAIANVLLLAMLAINFVNIASRLLFDVGIIWVFPLTNVMFVWVIFFAFFVIYRRGQDVAIDVITRRLPARVQALIQMFVSVVVIGLMAIVLAQAPTLIPRQVGMIDLIGIQRYWLSVPFFFSCTLIIVQFALHFATALAALRTGASPESPPR